MTLEGNLGKREGVLAVDTVTDMPGTVDGAELTQPQDVTREAVYVAAGRRLATPGVQIPQPSALSAMYVPGPGSLNLGQYRFATQSSLLGSDEYDHPDRRSKSITKKEAQAIAGHIKTVLGMMRI